MTAAHDGILAAPEEVLTAAGLHDGLGAPALRYLTDAHLDVIRADLSGTRDVLADRHARHPGRSICTG